MFRNIKHYSRGITVVEILIGMGVLVVILSLTAPSLSSSTAKAELKSALENVEFCIRMAKLTARQTETNVVMHLDTDPRAKQHSIRFSFPSEKITSENAAVRSGGLLQDYLLPPNVRLTTDLPSVSFDYQGEVEFAAKVKLAASHDEDLVEYLLVQ